MPKRLKKSMKLNCNFQMGSRGEGGGGGVQTKNFHLGIWLFSGKTLCVL